MKNVRYGSSLQFAWNARESVVSWLAFIMAIPLLPLTAMGRAVATAHDWARAGEFEREICVAEREMMTLSKTLRKYVEDQLDQQERLTQEFLRGVYVDRDHALAAWLITKSARDALGIKARNVLLESVSSKL
jgi:hypothetical protein